MSRTAFNSSARLGGFATQREREVGGQGREDPVSVPVPMLDGEGGGGLQMETGERDSSLVRRWIQIARDGGWCASFGWRGSLADQGRIPAFSAHRVVQDRLTYAPADSPRRFSNGLFKSGHSFRDGACHVALVLVIRVEEKGKGWCGQRQEPPRLLGPPSSRLHGAQRPRGAVLPLQQSHGQLGDMDHHVRSHNRKECQIFCEGCPHTFSWTSATWTPRTALHTSPPARRSFLASGRRAHAGGHYSVLPTLLINRQYGCVSYTCSVIFNVCESARRLLQFASPNLAQTPSAPSSPMPNLSSYNPILGVVKRLLSKTFGLYGKHCLEIYSFFKMSHLEIRDRLRSIILPLDAERLAIRESIRIAQLRLAETETQDFLDIVSERGALRQYISEYSSLLALIRLLPVEMLGRIFIQPTIHNSEMFGSTVVTMYRPKAIGEVSHHWREVPRGTPKLNRP
ncbi:hypothetical protein B0H14DRAFT_2636428 [Mycena olivaceomarginata]|nr:hypothetical protein B0H14DRAFT_2636428 [Mycena olivaceomarginata]